MQDVITTDDPYRLRPSAAGRWMNCPGSVALEHDTGDEDETGPAASEGQAAHGLAARLLDMGHSAASYQGEEMPDDGDPAKGERRYWPVTEEMVDGLTMYARAVREESEKPGAKLWIEQRLDWPGSLHGWTIDDETGEVARTRQKALGGTADAIVWNPKDKALHIMDLKYGRNVLVDVERNPQLMIYALLAMLALDLRPKSVHLHIIQPRGFHDDGAHRTYDMRGHELLAFDMAVTNAVAEAGAPGASLVPAPDGHGWCRFCSARESCPARLAQAVDTSRELAQAVPGVAPMWPEPVPPESLDSATLARVLPWLDIMDRWSKDARAVALARSEAEDIDGYKRVAGKGRRDWKDGVDAAAIDAALSHDVTLDDVDVTKPAELRTVAQLESLLGRRKFRELLADLVDRKQGKPRLVKRTEQGRELGGTAENEFDAE